MELAVAEEKKLVGFEVVEKDIDLVGQDIIGKIAGKHQGKLGFLKITVEGGFSALPLINKGIDFVEKKIPGDQTVWANMAKAGIEKALASIKL